MSAITSALRSLSRSALPASRLTFARSMSSEIPIGQVARVTRTHVGNEENAIKADAILADLKPKLAELPGYVKVNRTVCKGEWAYEVDIVFKDLDSFKGCACAQSEPFYWHVRIQ